MRFTCAVLLAAIAVLSCFGKAVYADRVDDLLAGKPVDIEALVAQDELSVRESGAEDSGSSPVASADEPTKSHVSQDTAPLADKSWDLALAGSALASHVEIPPLAGNGQNQPDGVINLVPEPSAIALATAALVYFLIFFRRRYSF